MQAGAAPVLVKVWSSAAEMGAALGIAGAGFAVPQPDTRPSRKMRPVWSVSPAAIDPVITVGAASAVFTITSVLASATSAITHLPTIRCIPTPFPGTRQEGA